jgi:hypothetical protein
LALDDLGWSQILATDLSASLFQRLSCNESSIGLGQTAILMERLVTANAFLITPRKTLEELAFVNTTG